MALFSRDPFDVPARRLDAKGLRERSGMKNLQALGFLLRSVRWESAEDQSGKQCSKQGKIKELKHFNKTS